jgi:hypothetical protein
MDFGGFSRCCCLYGDEYRNTVSAGFSTARIGLDALLEQHTVVGVFECMHRLLQKWGKRVGL